MARIDFYVLKGSGEPSRRQFACRLAEKAYRLQHRVHIRTADSTASAELDELLWTYRDGSFVPHEVLSGDPSAAESAVTIGHGDPPAGIAELLINLDNRVPESAASFARIAEIVTSDDDSRSRSREHYARYRELGHTLETHKL